METGIRLLSDEILERGVTDVETYGSSAFALWYILFALCCGCPALGILCGCLVYKCKGKEERLQDESEIAAEIARMEANIKEFQRHEKVLGRKKMLNTVENYVLTLTAEAFDATNDNDSKFPSSLRISDGCSICLSKYSVGDQIIRSPTDCGHVFHKDCLLDWFVTSAEKQGEKEGARCPCCRQQFPQPLKGMALEENVCDEV